MPLKHIKLTLILIGLLAMAGTAQYVLFSANDVHDTAKENQDAVADMGEYKEHQFKLTASDLKGYETLTEKNAEINVIKNTNNKIIITSCNDISTRDIKDFYLDDGEVDKDYLDSYVMSLKAEWDTYNTERQFTTADKEVITVGGSKEIDDTYGFLMNDTETFNDIYYKLVDYSPEDGDLIIEPVWYVPAIARNTVNGDIGDTYIEISLEKQHMWFFKEGKLVVDTAVVTGMNTEARHTPTGLFRVWYMDTNISLKGTMEEETWDSFVNYWIAITMTDVGIHDAPWRGDDESNYGGDIYTYNGSHGCINVPYSAEKMIYENVEMDTPVIIY